MAIPYTIARATYETLQADLADASRVLRAIPGIGSGPMGLTPEAIRATSEFRAANAAYQAAHDAARRFNGPFSRTYKREIRAERDARRASMERAQ